MTDVLTSDLARSLPVERNAFDDCVLVVSAFLFRVITPSKMASFVSTGSVEVGTVFSLAVDLNV